MAKKEYCPKCGELVEFKYDSIEVYCEDCGTHNGTKCPNCNECFDHVWGYERIEQYQNEKIHTLRSDI